MSLEGKRILVTGGTGLLGRALVPRLLDAGAWVAVTYRDNERLSALYAGLDPDGPQPKAVACELADPDSVEALAEDLAPDLPLDGIACLAGGWGGGQALWEAPPGQLEEMVRLNVLPTWFALRRFLPGMVAAGRGRAVTVGARHAVRGMKVNAAYGASKGAVVSLTESLAEDLRGSGVTVTCVMPSVIGTGGKGASPEDVAAAVAWMLDDEAGVLNGAVVAAYGG